MNIKEIRFTSPDLKSVLNFIVGTGNRVYWETTPEGEQGISRAFASPDEAGRFIDSYVRMKGYKRLVDAVDSKGKEIEEMHRTGRVPRWARFFKADSFN